MVSTRSRADFFHYLSCFLSFYAGHEWPGKSPLLEFTFNQDVSRGLRLNLSGHLFFRWEFPVGDVCEDFFCPRFVESILGLFYILRRLDIDFVWIAVG